MEYNNIFLYLWFFPPLKSSVVYFTDCHLWKQFVFISTILLFWKSLRIETIKGDNRALTDPKKWFFKYAVN